MKIAKPTPGPWKVYSRPLRGYLSNSRIIEVQASDGSVVVNWQGFDSAPGTTKRKLSNARLIAAAPDMYAALKAFDPGEAMHVTHPADAVCATCDARRAIAKAGGQPCTL